MFETTWDGVWCFPFGVFMADMDVFTYFTIDLHQYFGSCCFNSIFHYLLFVSRINFEYLQALTLVYKYSGNANSRHSRTLDFITNILCA
jgi:hypothetical protein